LPLLKFQPSYIDWRKNLNNRCHINKETTANVTCCSRRNTIWRWRAIKSISTNNFKTVTKKPTCQSYLYTRT